MKKVLKSKLTALVFTLVLVITQSFFSFSARAASIMIDNMNVIDMNNNANDVNVTVLESNSQHTVLKFDVKNFSTNLVDIAGESYYNITCKDTGSHYIEGAPDLPRISRNIIIPNTSDAKLNIISAEYDDYKNFEIAPSKGSITRNIDPKDIPYKLGKEYKLDYFYPSELVSLSEPFIMRELRGTTVTVNAFQYKPTDKTLRVYKSVIVEIITDGASTLNSIINPSTNRITQDFEPTYSSTFINYNNMATLNNTLLSNPSETGSMLIICYDQYSSAMNSFIQWKNSRGINTTLVNRSTVSSSNNATEIKSYIQNYYNQHPELTYVLLVGDYAQVSSPSYSTGVSDPTYTKVAGTDNYPDIYVGRFSAESIADVETQVQRTLEFEQNGYNTAAWFKKGVGIASAEGSGETDIDQINSVKTKLLNAGYTQVDNVYDPGATASAVTNSLNQGRGIITYCGHGAETYWVTTGFSNTNVQNLQNAGQLPFIISVSCVSGKFQTGTCFAEAWLRSKNSSGNPIGAIGTLMSTVNQPWVPPMNGQDGIIDVLCNNSRVSLGGICYSGQTNMIANGSSDDLLTFHTWTLFGDPSIQINSGSTPPDPPDPPVTDTYEPNDSTTQAYAINSGLDYNSFIYTNTDVDYYKITTNRSGVISISLSNLPADYDLYLYNSAGKKVASSLKGSTSSESISYSARTAGTYYIKVVGYNGANSQTTQYKLRATYPTN